MQSAPEANSTKRNEQYRMHLLFLPYAYTKVCSYGPIFYYHWDILCYQLFISFPLFTRYELYDWCIIYNINCCNYVIPALFIDETIQ